MCDGVELLLVKIRQAQEELNKLIEETQFDKDKVYKYSCKLDELINEFYVCTSKGNSDRT